MDFTSIEMTSQEGKSPVAMTSEETPAVAMTSEENPADEMTPEFKAQRNSMVDKSKENPESKDEEDRVALGLSLCTSTSSSFFCTSS